MTEEIFRPDEDISKEIEYPVGDHYTEIDESEADDDTTHLKQTIEPHGGSDSGVDYFGIADPDIIGTISSVKLVIRGAGNHWSHCYGKIKTHDTLYPSFIQGLDCSGNDYMNAEETWTTNPNTELAWTWQEIIDLQIYIRLLANEGDCGYTAWAKCTQVYIVVAGDFIYKPTVTTQEVTDVDSRTATGNGNITDTGGQNATKRGVCWSTSENPTVEDDIAEEEGDFGTGAFTAEMTGLDPNVTYYVKAYAYNEAGYGYGEQVEFTTNKANPIVTTQDPTDVLPNSLTGNGNITCEGGENCTERGFEYGLTKFATWEVHDTGSYPAGAFTKAITGLSANTEYWYRAYAKNTIYPYYGYGEWVQVQTGASGVIPTGTNLFICADLSGYSYQLMRSETDDGETYTAYFVISTDLTNKQGLAFYKRILDLHLYFMSESSGTATIYVKRDNETSWQTVGTVSLVGSADIIVPHLAPDIRAKHFLFKISASNFFRFLGILFEYLPEDLR